MTKNDSKTLAALLGLAFVLISLTVAVFSGSSASTVRATTLAPPAAEATVEVKDLDRTCVELDVSYIQQKYDLSPAWHSYAVDFVEQVDGSSGRADAWSRANSLGISDVPWASAVVFDCWR